MNAFRSTLVSLLSLTVFSLPVFAYPPMGVYKGSRGGSTAPSYSDYAGLHQFENWFGYQVPRSLDFVSYSSWSDIDGSMAWNTNLTSGWPPQRWRVTYSTPMLPADGVSTLAQGAAGAYDSHYTNFARALVNAGEGDAIIRLGWEMNGSWYAWRVLNATDATHFKNYWIRIVTAMRAVSGANFKFDFCPANGYVSYPSINSYPGDAYVDIIGLDVYNTSYATTDPAARWNEIVTQSYGMQYWADFATAHGKQLSYPEWGTGIRTTDSSGGGDDPLFIQNMFNWITSHNVAYHNYWDVQAPDFHAQLSSGQLPNSAAKFLELFGTTLAGQVPAPENVAGTRGNARVALTWTAVSGATGYNIQRASTIGHTFSIVGSSNATSYTDTGLTNGTTYYYVVTAVIAGVESAFSPRVSATPLDATIVDDADVSGVTITGSWTSSTSGDSYYGLDYLHDGNTGTTGGKSVQFTPILPAAGDYCIYARWTSGSNRATNTPITITSNAGTTNLTANQQINGGGWAPLGTFNFDAGATGNLLISNAAANGYVIADAVAFISVTAPQPPAIPTSVTAAAGSNQVSLFWPAATGATSYDVKRAVASGGPYSTIFSDLAATSTVDVGLVNGVTYYYTVSAKNFVGRSADSTAVSVAPTGPPSAPTGLAAATGDARVTLSWTASGGATSYNVKRAATTGGPYVTLGAGVTTTNFTDTGLTNQTTYYYVVSAVNSYGEGANSSELGAMPQAQFIVDNADATGVTIVGSWTVSTTATTYYGPNYLHDANTGATGGKSVRFTPNLPSAVTADVYLRWTAGTTRASNAPVDVNSAGGTTTVIVNQRNNDGVWVLLGRFSFNAGTGGNVTIRNDGANGFVIADAAKFVVASAITPPAAPTGLTATAGDAQVSLSWTAASGATTYTVKRATVSGGPYSTVASGLAAPNYTDTSLTNGTAYHYVVSASNLGGESAESAPASATPSGAAAVAVTYVSSGKVYTMGTALIGKSYTIDRTYTISALSPALNNSTMIRTSYDDKALTTATHLTFTVGQPSTVYVCYDTRVTTLPGFLDTTWALTSETFSTTHTLASPFKVYAKNFPAGSITLGANSQPPATGSWGATAAHYVVLIVPTPPTSASVTLSNLNQTYDGSPKAATATTTPAGLNVVLSYDGGATPPTNAGSYAVVAVVADSNYTGTATGLLSIAKSSTATLALSALNQAYGGTPKTAAVTTTPSGLAVNLIYDGSSTPPIYPGAHTVVATIDDANYTGATSDTLAITVTALVRHTPTLNGIVDGSMQLLTAENVTLNSNATISGDLLAPGTPTVQLNGQPAYAGTIDGLGNTAPSGYSVTLNSGAVLRHIVRHVDAISLPIVSAPAAPNGTRSVSLNNTSQNAGDFATLRDLTLNSNVGSVTVPAGAYGNFTANSGSGFVFGVEGATEPAIYNLQNLTLNSGSKFQIAGPVVLTLANGVALNASAGSAAHPEWFTLKLYSGGVTLNSNVSFSGTVIAPTGTVSLNSGVTLKGRISCDGLTLNSNALLDEAAP